MGRNISETHLKAYKEGCFKQLFSTIKEDPELSCEVRLDNEVMVYYHKDKILTTSFKSDKNPAVKILDSKYYALTTGRKAPSVDMQYKKNWHVVSLWRKYFSEAKSRRSLNFPWQAPEVLTKDGAYTIQEERDVRNAMQLCSESFDL